MAAYVRFLTLRIGTVGAEKRYDVVKLESPEQYRLQAKVCFGMAETAPNDEIKGHWLALSAGYTRAAAELEKKQTARNSDP